MTAVRCVELCRTFKQGDLEVVGLDHVNLDIEQGEFVCLVAPSGGGKTTLLNAIGGLDAPDAGEVWVAGRRIDTLSKGALAEMRLNNIGFVFQAYNLIPVLTARENVEFVMQVQGVAAEERRRKADAILAEVGLAGLEDRRPAKMSGGQQQRVAVARAIVSEPADSQSRFTHRRAAHGVVRRAQSATLYDVYHSDPRSAGDGLCATHRADARWQSGRGHPAAGRMIRGSCTAWLLLGLWFPLGAAAGEQTAYEFGGDLRSRATLQLLPEDSAIYQAAGDAAADLSAILRLKFAATRQRWDVRADGQLFLLYGDSVDYTRELAVQAPGFEALFGRLPNDDRRWWNLSNTLEDKGKRAAIARFDRLSAGFTNANLALRFGRQAISWGNGLVFTPMDIVNPFDPTQVDTEYKPGDDMLYGQ